MYIVKDDSIRQVKKVEVSYFFAFLQALIKALFVQSVFVIFLLFELVVLIGVGALPTYSALHVMLSHFALLMVGFALSHPFVNRISPVAVKSKKLDSMAMAMLWTVVIGIVLATAYFFAMKYLVSFQAIQKSWVYQVFGSNPYRINYTLIMVFMAFVAIAYRFDKLKASVQRCFTIIAVLLIMLAYLAILVSTFPKIFHRFPGLILDLNLLFSLSVPAILLLNLFLRWLMLGRQWLKVMATMMVLVFGLLLCCYTIFPLDYYNAKHLLGNLNSNFFHGLFTWSDDFYPKGIWLAFQRYTQVTSSNCLSILNSVYLHFTVLMYVTLVFFMFCFKSSLHHLSFLNIKILNVRYPMMDGCYYALAVLLEIAGVLAIEWTRTFILHMLKEYKEFHLYLISMSILTAEIVYIFIGGYFVFIAIMSAVQYAQYYGAVRLQTRVICLYVLITVLSVLGLFLYFHYFTYVYVFSYKQWANPAIIWFFACHLVVGIRFVLLAMLLDTNYSRWSLLCFSSGMYFICFPSIFHAYLWKHFHIWPASYLVNYSLGALLSAGILFMLWCYVRRQYLKEDDGNIGRVLV